MQQPIKIDGLTYAASVDPIYREILLELMKQNYIQGDAAWDFWSSGGGFEHFVVQRPDKSWLTFNSNETGITLSLRQHDDSKGLYKDFWSDDFQDKQYIMIDNANYTAQRSVADIVQDIVNNNFKTF